MASQTVSDVEFRQSLRSGLIKPGDKLRRLHWLNLFHKAATANQDHWACLFKALYLIAIEDYRPIERLLIKAQREGDWVFTEYGNHFILGILFTKAYWHRRIVKKSYDLLVRFQFPYRFGDKIPYLHVIEKHKAILKERLEESSNIYIDELINTRKVGTSPEIQASSHHALGILERFRAYNRIRKMVEQKKEFDWVNQYDREQVYYEKAIAIVEEANLQYPAPYSRIAGLDIARWHELDTKEQYSSNGKKLIESALNWAQKSIEACNKEYGEGIYFPPLSTKAFTKFILATIHKNENAINNASTELKSAMLSAPFDRTAWYVYRSYLDVLLGIVTEDKSYLQFLYNKLCFPTGTISPQIENELKVPICKSVKESNLNTLIILKKWSSYTPLMVTNRTRRTYGGGYLFNWQGKWVAIDPGVGFIELMYSYGVTIEDLWAVAITHDDTDHQQEMQALLALLGELNNRFNEIPQKAPRILHFLFSKSSHERWPIERFPKPFTIREPKIHFLDPTAADILIDEEVIVQVTPTIGHYDIGDRENKRDNGPCGTGVGLIFKLNRNSETQCKLGVTGDTSYCAQNEQTISSYYSECDILIVHISTVSDLDPQKTSKLIKPTSLVPPINNFQGYYKKHLGFWGTVSLLEDLLNSSAATTGRPLILLNEFGEEFLPIRTMLCGEIERCIKKRIPQMEDICCYPSDIGTRVSLETSTILCQFGQVCQNQAKKWDSQDPFTNEMILDESDPTASHQGWRDRQLLYLCKYHQWVKEHNDYNVLI